MHLELRLSKDKTAIIAQNSYHSYVFGNSFFMKNNSEDNKLTVPCDKIHVLKYFEKTSRISCICPDCQKKIIIQTNLVLDLFVLLCESLLEAMIPRSVAVTVSAHYREI